MSLDFTLKSVVKWHNLVSFLEKVVSEVLWKTDERDWKQENQLRDWGNSGRKEGLNQNSGTRKIEDIQGLDN